MAAPENTNARTRLLQEWAQPFLIVLSLFFAYRLPFEGLFISYALLGPLHYLTQISWLHDRKYFFSETGVRNFFVGVTLVLTLWVSIPTEFAPSLLPASHGVAFVPITLLLLALLLEMPLKGNRRALLLLLAPLAALALLRADFFVMLGTALIPSFCHVAVFTFTFLLIGAKRTKSRASIASAVIWLTAAGIIFFIPPTQRVHDLDWFNTHRLFFDPTAYALGGDVAEPLGPSWAAAYGLLTFAFTYHYLNWFSKTELLKWHQIPAKRGLGIIAIYIGSVGLYFYDYIIGLKVQLFLSFLHVFLEFPLNVQTIRALLSFRAQAAKA